jgi:hypothetical protein
MGDLLLTELKGTGISAPSFRLNLVFHPLEPGMTGADCYSTSVGDDEERKLP